MDEKKHVDQSNSHSALIYETNKQTDEQPQQQQGWNNNARHACDTFVPTKETNWMAVNGIEKWQTTTTTLTAAYIGKPLDSVCDITINIIYNGIHFQRICTFRTNRLVEWNWVVEEVYIVARHNLRIRFLWYKIIVIRFYDAAFFCLLLSVMVVDLYPFYMTEKTPGLSVYFIFI